MKAMLLVGLSLPYEANITSNTGLTYRGDNIMLEAWYFRGTTMISCSRRGAKHKTRDHFAGCRTPIVFLLAMFFTD
jgi:hypothetical protein